MSSSSFSLLLSSLVFVATVQQPFVQSASAAALPQGHFPQERLAVVSESVERIEQSASALSSELEVTMPVNFELAQQLYLLGETVRLKVHVKAPHAPNPELVVLQDCFRDAPSRHNLQMRWREASEGEFEADWSWVPPGEGNYLVKWKCDIGGDIPEFQRNFSVITGDWAVVIINTNANGAHPPEEHFHEYGIPSNLFSGIQLHEERASAGSFAGVSRDARQYGDGYTVSIWQSNTYMPGDVQDQNAICMYDEPDAVREAVLAGYRKLLTACGFTHSAKQIMVGPMSNDTMRAARQAGYDVIVGLYADQNWDDSGGHVQINHWGMPSRPFFMSTDDFRKEGMGGPQGALGVPQCHRHTALCRDYNCVFSLEAGADYMMDRYQQIHRTRTITPATWSRDADFFDSLLRNAHLSTAPLFFTCCYEFAGFEWMPEMPQIQEQMAAWVRKVFAERKAAPATPWGVADFYRRYYASTPESIVYLPDVWAGRVRTGYDRPRPAAHPDTMEMENGTFKALFRRGDVLPYVYYDYTTEWGYPHRDESGAPRNAGGYVIPNTEARFDIRPPILDTRQFHVAVDQESGAQETHIVMRIDAQAAQKDLALAVWDLPRTFTSSAQAVSLEGAAKRFVPVESPYAKNFNGIIIADMEPGRNELGVTITSPYREPASQDLALTDSVLAKVIPRGGVPMAYVYTIGEAEAQFTLTLPDGAEVKLYPHASISDEPRLLEGTQTLAIVPKEPVKISGMNVQEWLKACSGAKRIFPTVNSPYVDLPGMD